MEWDNKLGNSYGLDMAFPFLDRDLIQFMMAIPGEVQADQGVPKALIRRAMRGVVPEPILGRKWKADYTHVVNEGMAGEYLELIDCLESSGRAIEWGYLEKSVLRETLSPLRERLQRTDCQAAWQLSDLLGLELWLQAFFDFGPPAPPSWARPPFVAPPGVPIPFPPCVSCCRSPYATTPGDAYRFFFRRFFPAVIPYPPIYEPSPHQHVSCTIPVKI